MQVPDARAMGPVPCNGMDPMAGQKHLVIMTQFTPARFHADLGRDFFDPVAPADFPKTILRHRDQRWAERLGLGDLSDEQWLAHFGRYEPLAGSLPEPLALRYHGHQFRSYNPDLGDGRGF